MYSYSSGTSSKGEELLEPFYDDKTRTLFQSRGIPLDVRMKDYYSFVNTMVTLGVAFPNASGRSSRPKVRDCFNKEEQFLLKDYTLQEITHQEMMDNLPEFLAFVNFVKYVAFLKTLKDRGLTIQDSVATTEISYVNNTIHLFNLMRGMTSGKIAIETPNGTVCLDTLKTDEAVVEPLRNSVEDANELFAVTKTHIETIRKEFIEKEKATQLEMKKQLQSVRLSGFKETFKIMKPLIESGFEIVQEGTYINLKWRGKQHVTHLTLPIRYLMDVKEQQITIPIPPEISKALYVTELTLMIDDRLQIVGASGVGRHPHLASGSFCIGDAIGKDISSAPSVLYSITTANLSSFGGGSGRDALIKYCESLRLAIVNNDERVLEDSGLKKILDEMKLGGMGTVFGKRSDESW